MKNRTTKFGIALPQMFPDGKINPQTISEFVTQVESLNYDSVWVQDQLFSRLPTLSGLALLTYAAAFSHKIKLGTSVMLTALRSPVHFAKEVASVDQLSNGRLILGIGIGTSTEIYPAFGITPEHRVTRFEEGIALMKLIWQKDQVTFNGKFSQLSDVAVALEPCQKPYPPIWFGGSAEPALRRAVKIGDGWMGAGASSTNGFKKCLGMIREYLSEVGRDPANFRLSKRVYLAIGKDKKKLHEKLMDWFDRHYNNPDMAAKVAVFGSQEECIEGLGHIVSEDIDMVMLNPVFDYLEHAHILKEDIIPKLIGR